MDSKNSIWFEAISSYARVCARSIFLQITLISLLFFIPAFGVSAFDGAVGELKSADLKTKYDGLEKIKAFRTLDAVAALAQRAVSDRDTQFRLSVLDQIAALQTPVAVPLIKSLLRDKTPLIRQRTARVLGMLGGAEAEDALAKAVAQENDPSVKSAQLQGLSLCGSAKSVGVIQSALSDTRPEVRANAVGALARIPGSESQAALTSHANDDDAAVKKLRDDALKRKAKQTR